jgi:hypothetical protein
MGRLPQPLDDGLIYHVLNRGDTRADDFAEADDHEAFLQTMAQTQPGIPSSFSVIAS